MWEFTEYGKNYFGEYGKVVENMERNVENIGFPRR